MKSAISQALLLTIGASLRLCGDDNQLSASLQGDKCADCSICPDTCMATLMETREAELKAHPPTQVDAQDDDSSKAETSEEAPKASDDSKEEDADEGAPASKPEEEEEVKAMVLVEHPQAVRVDDEIDEDKKADKDEKPEEEKE